MIGQLCAMRIQRIGVARDIGCIGSDPSQFNRQSVPLKQHNNFVHIEWD